MFMFCLLIVTACASQEKEAKRSAKDSKSTEIAQESKDEESHKQEVPQPQILGGWEDRSLSDTHILEYYYRLKELILTEKSWELAQTPEKISAQVVAGMKYRFITNAKINGLVKKVDITIIVHLDDRMEILKCSAEDNLE